MGRTLQVVRFFLNQILRTGGTLFSVKTVGSLHLAILRFIVTGSRHRESDDHLF